MLKRLKEANYLYLWVFVAVVMLLTATYWLYHNAKENLYQASLVTHHQKVSHEINGIIEGQKKSAMAITLSLAENHQIKNFLCDSCQAVPSKKFDLTPLLEQISLHAEYKQLWVQLIDAQGVSRYRSWTDKKGDSLKKVRRDVNDMLLTPAVQQTMSVGRFSLTFKSMVPLFDENQKLQGMVEMISHLTPMAQNLKSSLGLESVILVDKRYRQQLTAAMKNRFLYDYYIANSDADSVALSILKHGGEDKLSEIEPVKVATNHIVTQHLIDDDHGLVMGYWYTFTRSSSVGFHEVERLKKQYFYALLIILFLTLLLLSLYILKKHADKGKRYYRNVLDSASEIIFVSNHQRIIEANQRFFEFYSEFLSLEQFLNKHHCVCDTFIEEEGFLQAEMDNKFWLDFVLENSSDRHIAKIEKAGKIHFFEITVARIVIYEKPLYSVIMHDITEQELNKQKLETLSETDVLTGISNRLVFNRTLTKEIQRAHRYQIDLSLLVFDVDFFKLVNDNYGHDVGDQVLVTLTDVVSGLLRETDVFSRIGGEEFTVLMPETGLEQAQNTAERLRKAIENLSEEALPMNLTMSFGVACMNRWDSDKTLFRRADDALYKAKDNGRNRVEVALDNIVEKTQKNP